MWSVNYGSAKCKNAQKSLFYGNSNSGHASQNVAELSILTSEINPENFRLIS